MTQTNEPRAIAGYCDKISVVAGESVQFKVSCYEAGRYRADLVQIICGDKTPGGAGYEERVLAASFAGEYPGREQQISMGSYGHVDLQARRHALPAMQSFTLQAMVYATTVSKGLQGLMGTWCDQAQTGTSLVIAENGSLGLLFSDRHGTSQVLSTGVALPERHWTQVSASYDHASNTLTLRQQPQPLGPGADLIAQAVTQRFSVSIGFTDRAAEEFILAALLEKHESRPSGTRLCVRHHFNGKLDRPRWSAGALSALEVQQLNDTRDPGKLSKQVVACWDFSLDISSTRLSDRGLLGLHGQMVNLPTRAVTGFNWDGSAHNWQHVPHQYGAIHFHDDDLYDAGWETDFTYTIPNDLPSGIYAARLCLGAHTDHVVFYVRPGAGRTRAPIAFLASTATYMAYGNNVRTTDLIFAVAKDSKFHDEVYQTLRAHPEFGRSTYDIHHDGSGVHHSSRLRPILDMKPGAARMWSFTADTLITAWLAREGYAFDVLTDEDLHQQGVAALEGYRVVLTGSHPEYMSRQMRDGIDEYLGGGGRLMYLGANGFYLRIAYHETLPGVIELRRVEKAMDTLWGEEVGQHYHSFTGEHGGLWQRSEKPTNRSVGVGFLGLAVGAKTHYRRVPGIEGTRAAFILDGVEGDVLNDFGTIYGPLYSDEFDVCRYDLGSPPHTLVIASSLQQPGTFSFDPDLMADMVFFECPRGGAVFSTSSISWGLGLHLRQRKSDVARVTANVLNRFIDPAAFPLPEVQSHVADK